jgi:hypothetical protein
MMGGRFGQLDGCAVDVGITTLFGPIDQITRTATV